MVVCFSLARSKTRKPQKHHQKHHRNFFTTFSLPTFWFWPILKIENLVKKKTRKKNSEVSEVSNVSEFLICQFLDFLIKCPRFQIDSFFSSFVILLFSFLTLVKFVIPCNCGLWLSNMQIHVQSHTNEEQCVLYSFKV